MEGCLASTFVLVLLAIIPFAFVYIVAKALRNWLIRRRGEVVFEANEVHYKLVPFSSPDKPSGNGFYILRVNDNQRLHWQTLPSEFLSFPVAGASHRRKQIQDPSFEPGSSLSLIPEPDNEHDPDAVMIWNESRTIQAGYVPREYASVVRSLLDKDEISYCWVMWQVIDKSKRVALRALVVTNSANLKL